MSRTVKYENCCGQMSLRHKWHKDLFYRENEETITGHDSCSSPKGSA
jgi:hypothetical protein